MLCQPSLKAPKPQVQNRQNKLTKIKVRLTVQVESLN
jgi:hypothetical protein